jgi:cytochrome P450
MERGNTKHGVHLDRQLAEMVRTQLRGGHTGTDEWSQAEPPGLEPVGATALEWPDGVGPLSRQEIAARSELGRWIPRSALPTERDALLRLLPPATPDHVVELVSALPAGRSFETVTQMWGALGHVNEARATAQSPPADRRSPARATIGTAGPARRRPRRLPAASAVDTAATVAVVLGPLFAQGLVIRRRWMVALADRLQTDRRAARVMRRLRTRYGRGPVRLRIPLRRVALVLDASDAARLLAESPHPFTPASREKRAALRHLQPHGVLVSEGPVRDERRELNESTLDTDRPVPRLGETIARCVRTEIAALMDAALRRGTLTWPMFAAAHVCQVRRIVREQARDDEAVTDLLASLRADAMATYRALALLVTHPDGAEAARRELRDPDSALTLPYLRACVLESVRLWPTTTVVLRDAAGETEWRGAVAEPGTSFVIVSSYLHRDERRLEQADSFAPQTWLDDRSEPDPGIIPFGAGPARCPGRDVALLVAATSLAEMLRRHRIGLPAGTLTPGALPCTLDQTRLRFRVRNPRPPGAADASGQDEEA